MMLLTPEMDAAIKQHAVDCYPNEMCGAITVDGAWMPMQNRAEDPKKNFECTVECEWLIRQGTMAAMVHSHPDGPEAPSYIDIAAQISMDVPWGIVLCNEHEAASPYFWGDAIEPPPLLGRQFRHGPSGTDNKGDCYALIRDWYRHERNIRLPEFVRGDSWWQVKGLNLYEDGYRKAGFIEAPSDTTEVGDVILMQVRSPAENPVINHGAIQLGNGLLMHHLEGRLSRVEPIIGWSRFIRKVLRYVG